MAKLYNKKIFIKKVSFRKGSTKLRVPDIRKIKKLGFKPKHNLQKGFELGSRMLILDSGRLVYDVERETISMGELEAAYFGNIRQEVAG